MENLGCLTLASFSLSNIWIGGFRRSAGAEKHRESPPAPVAAIAHRIAVERFLLGSIDITADAGRNPEASFKASVRGESPARTAVTLIADRSAAVHFRQSKDMAVDEQTAVACAPNICMEVAPRSRNRSCLAASRSGGGFSPVICSRGKSNAAVCPTWTDRFSAAISCRSLASCVWIAGDAVASLASIDTYSPAGVMLRRSAGDARWQCWQAAPTGITHWNAFLLTSWLLLLYLDKRCSIEIKGF